MPPTMSSTPTIASTVPDTQYAVTQAGSISGARHKILMPGERVSIGPDDITKCGPNQLPRESIREHLNSGYLEVVDTRNDLRRRAIDELAPGAEVNPAIKMVAPSQGGKGDDQRGRGAMDVDRTGFSTGNGPDRVQRPNLVSGVPGGPQISSGINPVHTPPGVVVGGAQNPGGQRVAPSTNSPRSRFTVNPATLANKGLDELNVMVQERLPDDQIQGFSPFTTTQEAIAFLSADFNPGTVA